MPTIELAGLTLSGESVAGIGTAIAVRELKICFDLGVLTPAVLACSSVFVSHGHTDHAGELFNYLATRALENRNMATIYVPAQMGDPLQEILRSWQSMAESRFDYRLVRVHPGASIPLRNRTHVLPFPLHHRPPTLGFLVSETVQKLKEEYRDLPGEEIAARKRSGEEASLFFSQDRSLVAYVPDTLPEGLDSLPDAAWTARILMIEASFLDDRKPLEHVRAGRHLRLDDILCRLDKFRGESLVLFHFSRIYPKEEVEPLVRSRIPQDLQSKVVCFL